MPPTPFPPRQCLYLIHSGVNRLIRFVPYQYQKGEMGSQVQYIAKSPKPNGVWLSVGGVTETDPLEYVIDTKRKRKYRRMHSYMQPQVRGRGFGFGSYLALAWYAQREAGVSGVASFSDSQKLTCPVGHKANPGLTVSTHSRSGYADDIWRKLRGDGKYPGVARIITTNKYKLDPHHKDLLVRAGKLCGVKFQLPMTWEVLDKECIEQAAFVLYEDHTKQQWKTLTPRAGVPPLEILWDLEVQATWEQEAVTRVISAFYGAEIAAIYVDARLEGGAGDQRGFAGLDFGGFGRSSASASSEVLMYRAWMQSTEF